MFMEKVKDEDLMQLPSFLEGIWQESRLSAKELFPMEHEYIAHGYSEYQDWKRKQLTPKFYGLHRL
jgi:hypothetical protein